jgi:hypothetical protein
MTVALSSLNVHTSGVEECGGEEEVERVCGLGNFHNASIAGNVKL